MIQRAPVVPPQVTMADVLDGVVGCDGTTFRYDDVPPGMTDADVAKMISLYPNRYKLPWCEPPASAAGAAGRALLHAVLSDTSDIKQYYSSPGEWSRAFAISTEYGDGEWGTGTNVEFMRQVLGAHAPSLKKTQKVHVRGGP
jgi:hypothetical protein